MMLKNKIKKSIGILTMACFLATPIGYAISASTTEAAPPPPRHRMEPPPSPHHKTPSWRERHLLHSIDGKMIIEDQMLHLHHLDIIVIDDKNKTSDLFCQRFLFTIDINYKPACFLNVSALSVCSKEGLHLYGQNDHKLLFERKLDDVSLIL